MMASNQTKRFCWLWAVASGAGDPKSPAFPPLPLFCTFNDQVFGSHQVGLASLYRPLGGNFAPA